MRLTKIRLETGASRKFSESLFECIVNAIAEVFGLINKLCDRTDFH
ncbi:hypothetical protein AB0759_39670 [Scytonema tolypothrichoides VB-61278_2]|uniref:Uncharacterized protein n=1 Tax=Scytonema tolypothrichoides VB-61278_2 TaxID=3232314 RepID=A0ABW8X018_9CYAN